MATPSDEQLAHAVQMLYVEQGRADLEFERLSVRRQNIAVRLEKAWADLLAPKAAS